MDILFFIRWLGYLLSEQQLQGDILCPYCIVAKESQFLASDCFFSCIY